MDSNTHHGRAPFLIACVGLEWRTEVSLKTVLDVIRNQTSVPWNHTDDTGNAQVLLYDPANALAQAMLRKTQAEHSSRVLIPCGTAHTDDDDYMKLPIGATQLLNMLDRVALRLDGSIPMMVNVPLSQKLDEALNRRDVLGVAITSGQNVGFIAPKQKAIYWPKPLDAGQIASMLMDGLRIMPFTANDKDLSQRFQQHSSEMTGWDPAMWTIGVSAASTRLSRHLDPEKTYQVTRWPDFGPIGRKTTDIKFISMLSQRPYSPAAVAATPGFSASMAYKYFNASALCGILEPVASNEPSAAADAQMPAQSLVSNFMRGLRRAFSLEAH